jgi:hypothetical protein
MFAFSDKKWPGVAKLVEECGEAVEILGPALLVAALGKIIQTQGKLMMIDGTTDHWSGDLRTALVEEIADVEAAITFVKENNLSKKEIATIRRRVASKLKKFEKWHHGNEVKRRIAKNASKAKSRTSNA